MELHYYNLHTFLYYSSIKILLKDNFRIKYRRLSLRFWGRENFLNKTQRIQIIKEKLINLLHNFFLIKRETETTAVNL